MFDVEQNINYYYNIKPDEGKIYCKAIRCGNYKQGEEIKGSIRQGYVIVELQGKTLTRSRLIWWAATGSWPTYTIDHINRIKTDDRILNLRDVTLSENNTNVNKPSGLPPYVTWHSLKGYRYYRTHEGKRICCGYYDTPENAVMLGYQEWLRRTT